MSVVVFGVCAHQPTDTKSILLQVLYLNPHEEESFGGFWRVVERIGEELET
jgi:hypothetical protein